MEVRVRGRYVVRVIKFLWHGSIVESHSGPRSTRAWRTRCKYPCSTSGRAKQCNFQARPRLGGTSSLRFFAKPGYARAPPFVYALGALCAISSSNRAHIVRFAGTFRIQLSSFGRVSTPLVTAERSNSQPRTTSRHQAMAAASLPRTVHITKGPAIYRIVFVDVVVRAVISKARNTYVMAPGSFPHYVTCYYLARPAGASSELTTRARSS